MVRGGSDRSQPQCGYVPYCYNCCRKRSNGGRTYLRDVVFVVTLVAARVVDGLDGDGDVGHRKDGGEQQHQQRQRQRPHFRWTKCERRVTRNAFRSFPRPSRKWKRTQTTGRLRRRRRRPHGLCGDDNNNNTRVVPEGSQPPHVVAKCATKTKTYIRTRV